MGKQSKKGISRAGSKNHPSFGEGKIARRASLLLCLSSHRKQQQQRLPLVVAQQQQQKQQHQQQYTSPKNNTSSSNTNNKALLVQQVNNNTSTAVVTKNVEKKDKIECAVEKEAPPLISSINTATTVPTSSKKKLPSNNVPFTVAKASRSDQDKLKAIMEKRRKMAEQDVSITAANTPDRRMSNGASVDKLKMVNMSDDLKVIMQRQRQLAGGGD